MFILFSGCRDDDVDCGGEAESFKGRCFYILFNSPFGSTTRNKPRAVRPFRIFSQILGDIRSSRFATGVNDTGGKRKKTFNQINFNNFVWSPLGSRGNIYINFCLQVYFQASAAWYCSHYLPPVSMTLLANCRRYQRHRRQIAAGFNDTGGKFCHKFCLCCWHRWQFATGVINTGGK